VREILDFFNYLSALTHSDLTTHIFSPSCSLTLPFILAIPLFNEIIELMYHMDVICQHKKAF
jgi:hypothetical protein